MATRNHTLDRVEGNDPDANRVIRWAGLLTTDVGDWITIPAFADYTVQLVIDSGTTLAALSIEGSNEVGTPAAKNIGILHDSRGSIAANNLTFAFADGGMLRQGLEAPVKMRPNFSGTGDSSVTVIIRYRKEK